jgi:hypothetical protein
MASHLPGRFENHKRSGAGTEKTRALAELLPLLEAGAH